MTTKKHSNAKEDLSYIVEPLRPLAVEIGTIFEDPANVNLHDERSIRAIMGSFARYGQRKPLVVNRAGNIVEAGNGGLEAARRLGWTHVAVVFVDDDPTTHTGYAIADNRTAQLSEFDMDALVRQLEALKTAEPDAPAVEMYDADEMAELRAALEKIGRDEEPGARPDPGPPPPDRLEELAEQWGTAFGQLWEIPSVTLPDQVHRLLCGDSTNPAHVRYLMDGKRATLFATDPPYLVDYDGTNHPHKWGEPDKNKDWSGSYQDWDKVAQGEGLYEGFVATAVAEAITGDAAWYCWHASRNQALLERVWNRHGAFVHQQIIWRKDRPVLTRSFYMWQHEPCFFGWVRGNKPKRISDDFPRSVWELPTIKAGVTTDHPTSKPVEVFAIPMRQHTTRGDVCYEPFAGSGSQQVAGEQIGRLVYGLENQPVYVAAILERLSGMGLEPVLVGEMPADVLNAPAPVYAPTPSREDEEKAALLALRTGRALVRDGLDVYAIDVDGEKALLCSAPGASMLWACAMEALEVFPGE